MKPALILYGPPGCGKTTWIKQEAQARQYKLFRWNVRTDRSLREGREVLHSQVRSQGKTLIWVEGADDLTQEAQAFLRRILDTRSVDVTCILEVRDPTKLSAPVLSRCSLMRMPTELSYRQTLVHGKALECGILEQALQEADIPKTLESLAAYKKAGRNPNPVLSYYVKSLKDRSESTEALRRWASGHSVWTQVAWLVSLCENCV
jgi:DNA polymerase III delta prime subunit